jgi:hypothetical protein
VGRRQGKHGLGPDETNGGFSAERRSGKVAECLGLFSEWHVVLFCSKVEYVKDSGGKIIAVDCTQRVPES